MNIAICGTVGSGKTTLAKIIAERDGREFISARTLFRQYAKEHGKTLEEMNSSNTDEIDEYIDSMIEEISQRKDNLVIEARYSGRFCRNAKYIFLYCNPKVAAKRIFNDNRDSEKFNSLDDCLYSNIRRMNTEQKRGIDKYQFDMFDMSHYDLIVDTTFLNPDQTIGYLKYNSVYLHGSNLLPTQSFRDVDPDVVDSYTNADFAEITVSFSNYLWYIQDSHHRVLSRMRSTPEILLPCRVVKNVSDATSISEVYSYEDYGKFRYNMYSEEVNKLMNENSATLVKKILFGNQKQANVTNDAVVAIVVDYLHDNGYAVTNLDDCKFGIEELLREMAEHGVNRTNETFIKLVAGIHSYEVLKSGVPYILTAEQPNIESPKYIFRIHELGAKVSEPESVIDKAPSDMGRPKASFDEVVNPDDSLESQVNSLKDAILPMAPDAVKEELHDEYKIALYCAKAYFEYESR